MTEEEFFWESSVEDLAKGYVYHEESDEFVCLICKQRYENGVIYKRDEMLYEAKKAIIYHINDVHDSMFDYLLSMDKKYTGLSEHQVELLRFFKQGLTDREIVSETGGGSTSTIRNHRFKLKEKQKQAKVFLTIMKLLKSEKEEVNQHLVTFHKGAKMVDERYATTLEEKEKILSTYFKEGPNGPLETFPSKEKRKIIVLQHILKRFETNKMYSEKEINNILKSIYSDFVTIRRYLIEYGFMNRSKDCSQYWVKN